MDLTNLAAFLAFLFVLVKSADYATRYSSRLARLFHVSEFIVSFFIVALISAAPEGTIAILSAIKGMPELGLGTLMGSNVADLALVFGIAAVFSLNGVSVKSKILKKDLFYLALILFPVLLGLDGNFSRVEGILLVLAGLSFFFTLSIESNMFSRRYNGLKDRSVFKNLALVVLSLAALVLSAHFAIKFGVAFANDISMPPILIGLTVISIGSCMPELFFSIKAIRHHHEQLALGDVLGTVITDATILLGIVALISPFSFEPAIIYVTGLAMFIAGVLVVYFISTDKILTRKEGIFLLVFYLIYLLTEIILHKII